MKEVKYDKIDVLITKEYFSIYENSVEYVWGLWELHIKNASKAI